MPYAIEQFAAAYASAHEKLDEILELLLQVRAEFMGGNGEDHIGALRHVTEKLEEVAVYLRP